MVAVAHASPGEIRRLVLVRTTPVVRYPAAPVPAATYRRRRVMAAAVVAGVLVAFAIAVQALSASFAGGPPAATSSSPVLTGPVHVVAPGDTFWDIARALRPHDDPRPLVDRLVAAHGSPVLVVGERVTLPAAA